MRLSVSLFWLLQELSKYKLQISGHLIWLELSLHSFSASQRAEELAETASVWSSSGSREIEMSQEKIETIKSLMSGMVLGSVPDWAKTLDPSKIGQTQKKDT